MDLHFKPRVIGDSLISTLRNLYYYTGRWDLSVKNFTGKNKEYWEELPDRIDKAKGSPQSMKMIIKELKTLAEGSKARQEKRVKLINTEGFQKKEVVINEQLLAILAALPQEMLSGIFRNLISESALPEVAGLVDVKLGSGEQLIEPDFLVRGDNRLIMGELKVNAKQGTGGTKYDAKQLFNYLSLAIKCLSSRNVSLTDSFSHLIILPQVDFEWFVQGSDWIKNLQAGPDRHMEFHIETAFSLADKKKKQKYVTDENKLRQLLSDIPIYCRSYYDFLMSFKEVIDDYPLQEHWKRIALELKYLCKIATLGLWLWITGKVDTSKEHVKILYGDPNKTCWDDFRTVALLSPPVDQTYTVEFLVAPEGPYEVEMINAVKKELDFFLIEKGEENPWAYVEYHCGTAANLYSNVHWAFCPKSVKLD
jgi:hypothetical protein